MKGIKMSDPSVYLATLLKYAESNLQTQLQRLEDMGFVYQSTKAPSSRLRIYIYLKDVYHDNAIHTNNSQSLASLVFEVPAPSKTLMSQIKSITAQSEQIQDFLERRALFLECLEFFTPKS